MALIKRCNQKSPQLRAFFRSVFLTRFFDKSHVGIHPGLEKFLAGFTDVAVRIKQVHPRMDKVLRLALPVPDPAYSEDDLRPLGTKPSAPFNLKTRTVVSQDGEIKDQVPVGIDPGWNHNVGQSWLNPELALGQKLAALPRYLQEPMVDI